MNLFTRLAVCFAFCLATTTLFAQHALHSHDHNADGTVKSEAWKNSPKYQIMELREDYKASKGIRNVAFARNGAERHEMGGPVCQLRASDMANASFVAPPEAFTRRQNLSGSREDCANIVVTYTGFTAEAQQAFQHAVDIWESLITSPVEIRVDAVFQPLAPGVLGSAGSNFIWRNFPGAVPDTWYADALADKIAGEDLIAPFIPGAPDIVTNFSSTFSWYFGRDGQAPPGTFDFVTVVLHELGHGLGFFGSAAAIPDPLLGVYGFTSAGVTDPTIYDLFTENGAGTMTTAIDPPGAVTPALGAHFQSNDLFVDAPLANAGNGGSRPAIYAPSSFQGGSSYSHWDEATYPAGTPQSLMTPQLGFQEANHDPGTATLGMFQDHGWMTTMDCPEVDPVDDKERCDITGLDYDPNFPAPGVCREDLINPNLTSPGTFVACYRIEGIDPYSAPVDGSGYKVIIDGDQKPILFVGWDVDGGGNQYLLICVGEVPLGINNGTLFVELESGCTWTRNNFVDSPTCMPNDPPCDITNFTLRSSNPTPCNGDGSHDLKLKVFGDGLPATDADAKVVIDGTEYPIASWSLRPNGTVNLRVNDIQVTSSKPNVFVQAEAGCTWYIQDMYDTPSCNTRIAGTAIGNAFVYPNPTNGSFTISGKGLSKASYRVLNAVGQVVLQGNIENYQDEVVDLVKFDKGLYIISVVQEGEVRTERLIKQ